MTIFLTLCFIGFTLLAFSLIFGHDHDFDHGDLGGGEGDGFPKGMNLKVVSAFLTAFGAGGALARYYDFSMIQSSIIGIVGGAALAYVMFLLLRFVYSQQASSHITQSDVVGQKARVTIRIAPDGLGEVTCSVKGSSYAYIAQAENREEIQQGSLVEIIQVLGECAVVRVVTL